MTSPRAASGDQVFLDHLGIYVPDIETVPQRLERLGFQLTPVEHHVNADGPDGALRPSGTANRCIMLQEGYLEVLGPTADTPLARRILDGLARYAGVHLLAFGADRSAERHAALPDQGLEPLPLVRLERPIRTEQGEGLARFSVIRFSPEAMPEGRIQICDHQTPELMWQPRWLNHANGAEALTGVLLAVEDVAEVADRYARLVGKPVATAPHGAELRLDRGVVTIVEPGYLPEIVPGLHAPTTPFIAAVGLRSADPDGTTRYLAETARVPLLFPDDDHVVLPGREALGMTVVFHAPGTAPWRLDAR